MPSAMGSAIVATCFGDRDTGGGAFVLDGDGGAERIDWVASTGIAVSPDGGRLARLLRDPGAGSSGELLVYDARGVELYRRVDPLTDSHDIVWNEDGLVAVSTSTNAILWLTESGDVVRTWTAPGTGDAWHLNSLVMDRGRLLACAFGRFPDHRGWAVPGAAAGQGFVFDVASGEEEFSGYTFPHHPVRLGDCWTICDSREHAFVVLDDRGIEARRVQLGGFTRGVAVTGDRIYVGLSVRRGEEAAGETASVVVLDRRSLDVLHRVPLPSREVYAVALVPEALVEGMRRGFRTNPLRAADDDMLSLFRQVGVEPERLWAVSDPLPPEACRVEVSAVPPATMQEGASVDVGWTLANHGGAILHSADPYPVHVAARWYHADGRTLLAESERARLPRAVPPGQETSGSLPLATPAGVGDRVLRISAVQEQVRWFDDIDQANGVTVRIRVVSA